VLYGPYFAQFAGETVPGLQYILPVLLSIILVSLDNIQDHLENPFNQIGADDGCLMPKNLSRCWNQSKRDSSKALSFKNTPRENFTQILL